MRKLQHIYFGDYAKLDQIFCDGPIKDAQSQKAKKKTSGYPQFN
jgi:hypothetical protein